MSAGTPSATAETLQSLGAGALDQASLAGWWTAHAPARPPRRRYGSRAGDGLAKNLSPSLAAARASQDWMEAGLTDRPDPLLGLRGDAADRVAGRGRPVSWPLAFLHLVAESARMGLRELDRLEAAAEQGRGVVANGDKRSPLKNALDVLLHVANGPVACRSALSKASDGAPL